MKSEQLPKTYDPKLVEDRIYDLWEASGKFKPENLDLPKDAESFSIVLPPPNATGQLHLGHAMYVVQDIMIRHARMEQKRTLWLPGTDHAAIAVNALVEKQLRVEGLTKEQIGREAFMKRVHEFIAASQGRIKTQLQKMGFSLDWSRDAYTLDKQRSRVVQEVFRQMHEDGLIYRGVRVVNWDPIAKSTISDDEVQYEEQEATLYTFRYSKDFPIAISTTRPETKVGDTAVAVHPDDRRYQKYVGKEFDVEFSGAHLHLKIVANKNIDPKFGTGALGVTPSHSIIDAEIAQEHHLPFVTVIQEDGTMSAEAGSFVAGLSVKEARERVVAWLKEQDLFEAEATIRHNVSLSERTGAVVEPLPKEQWFINVNQPFAFRLSKPHPIQGLKEGQRVTLKEVMRHVVESDQIQIVPDRFKKTYFQWINHLRDWNISRQIWFGHRVPVWTKGKQNHVGTKPQGGAWIQDPDTLDTWFSSATWTFSTLGWPTETEDLKRFHPTSVLETGYDILFFWVARMILMTTYALGEVPFRKVYLHGLVRDKKGAKLSKSKGNGIDPLEMSKKYGTDAVRLSLVSGTTPGNDLRLYEEKIEGYRNFVNKFWNISRYILSTVKESRIIMDVPFLKTDADKWIIFWLNETIKEVNKFTSEYQYGAAIEVLNKFTWGKLADWYLEISKIEKEKDDMLLYILQMMLRLWHPYTPFITENIYQMLKGRSETLMTVKWPENVYDHEDDLISHERVTEMQHIVNHIRGLRAEMNIANGVKLLVAGDLGKAEDLKHLIEAFGKVKIVTKLTGKTLSLQKGLEIQLEGVVDFAKERAKTEKELKSVESYVKAAKKKLANKKFIANAPKEIVEGERRKCKDAQDRITSLKEKLKQLGA